MQVAVQMRVRLMKSKSVDILDSVCGSTKLGLDCRNAGS
jgi:hypothetical protein